MTALNVRPFLYLASQSPRRSELLTQLGIAHQRLVAAPDEDTETLEQRLGAETPKRYVQRVTRLKLDAAIQRCRDRALPDAPILCADTTVALGSIILGKPTDDQQAAEMIAQLAGRQHRVLTAVALFANGKVVQACSESRVQFAPLGAAQIQAYVRSGEPFGKAGGYGIQGRAAAFISEIKGSYSGVMGLPLFETAQLLDQLGWKAT